MYVEMLTVLLLDEDMATIGADQGTDFEVGFILVEPEATYLAQELTTSAGVVVEIGVRRTAAMAYSFGRHRIATTRLNRLEFLAML